MQGSRTTPSPPCAGSEPERRVAGLLPSSRGPLDASAPRQALSSALLSFSAHPCAARPGRFLVTCCPQRVGCTRAGSFCQLPLEAPVASTQWALGKYSRVTDGVWLDVLSLPCWFWAARPHLHHPGPGLPPAEGVPSLHVGWVPSAAWPCAQADSDERPSAAPVINSASEGPRSSRLGAAVWVGSFSGSVTPLQGAGVPPTPHGSQRTTSLSCSGLRAGLGR